MLAPEVIRKKRDGGALDREEIAFLVGGITDGSLSDAQVGALAMAFFLKGLNNDERLALTTAMRDSGSVLDWDLDKPVADKHSTGGVGDKVSLMLAPILAACGVAVPMISGRGLGHTGGTLDKLDSIPGYTSTPATEVIRRVVRDVGCAIVGQTSDLAPADKRLYATRDATGTVESIPLIVASIHSKKLAEGLDSLVLDVKTGSGAFMARRDEADELARAMVEVANGAGVKTTALITDMNQVLGLTAGNALEVSETVDYLTGAKREPRLHEVTMALAAAVVDRAEAEKALESGAAAEVFGRMVNALGGPADFVENPTLPSASVVLPVLPQRPGYVTSMDTRAVGLVVTGLGGNRRREDDAIDYSVGLSAIAPIGAAVGPDRPLALVHARGDTSAREAATALAAAVRVGEEAPGDQPVLLGRA